MKIKEFKSKNIEKKLIRNPNSNKGDYGHVLVIAGNLGFGGAIFIGLDSPVVKSHGGTDFIGFANSLDVCNRIVKGNLIKKIKQNL